MRQRFADDIRKASYHQHQQEQKQYPQPIPRSPPIGYNRADNQAYNGECHKNLLVIFVLN